MAEATTRQIAPDASTAPEQIRREFLKLEGRISTFENTNITNNITTTNNISNITNPTTTNVQNIPVVTAFSDLPASTTSRLQAVLTTTTVNDEERIMGIYYFNNSNTWQLVTPVGDQGLITVATYSDLPPTTTDRLQAVTTETTVNDIVRHTGIYYFNDSNEWVLLTGSGGTGGGVPFVDTFADLPSTTTDRLQAVTTETMVGGETQHTGLYYFNDSDEWVLLTGSGGESTPALDYSFQEDIYESPNYFRRDTAGSNYRISRMVLATGVVGRNTGSGDGTSEWVNRATLEYN